MGEEQKATSHLEKCKETSRHIKNFRLNLDALICLSRLKCRPPNRSEKVEKGDPMEAAGLFREALEYAHKLGDAKYARSCVSSLGIMAGSEDFDSFVQKNYMGALKSDTPNQTREIGLRVSRDMKTTKPRSREAGNN